MELLIKEFLQKNAKIELFQERQILVNWNEMMQNTLFKTTKATKIQNGVLYISHLTSAQRFELMGMRSFLIDELNKSVGNEIVKGIIFN